MKVELHSHTNYSRGKKIFYDGIASPDEMVHRAKKLGLGAIAITDHNTMLGIEEAKAAGKKYGVTVIPGEEISSKHGHVTALGISETIRPGLSIFDTVDLIHAQGGVAISVHPFDINNDGLRERAKACDAIEIFNGVNIERISNIKSRNFATRTGMVQVAGSDAHCPDMLGSGIINTRAKTVNQILDNIRNGKITPEYKYLPITTIMRYSVRKLGMSFDHTQKYIDNNYTGVKRTISKKMLGTVKYSPGSIDKFFSLLAYVSLASTVTYSFWRNGIRG